MKLEGFVGAAFTPMDPQGELDLGRVPQQVEHAVRSGMAGLYVCGSTGQGPSLSGAERRQVLEAFVSASGGRLPILVQVGCESLKEAQGLAAHAQEVGADAVSALPPTYFAPQSTGALVDCLECIAASAPDLPFFYYHIPELSGVAVSMPDLFELAAERLSSLGGVKYTAPTLDDLQAGLELAGSQYQLLYGRDEMILAALAGGVRAAIGSTYNLIPAVYQRLFKAFHAGDLQSAREAQARSLDLIRLIPRFGRASQKAMMDLLGLPLGPPRLPVQPLDPVAQEQLAAALRRLGFLPGGAEGA